MRAKGTIRFGDIADFRNGLNYSARDVGPGLKIVGVLDFRSGLRPDLRQLDSIQPPQRLDPDALLCAGDLLFVRSNGSKNLVGRCMIMPTTVEPVSHSGFTIRGRLTRRDIDPLYVAYFFQSLAAREQIRRQGGGTNISNLSQAVLADISVPVGTPAFQKQVATIGDGFDQEINLLSRLIDRFVALFDALASDIFNRRGKPGGAASWRPRTLGEFFEPVVEENGTAVREVLSCSKVHGILPRGQKFRNRPRPTSLRRYKVVRRGDLVVDRMLLWDGSLSFVERVPEGVVSPDYATFRFKGDEEQRLFFRGLLKSARARHLYKSLSRGSNVRRRRVQPRDFLGMTFSIPDAAEQRRWGEVFATFEHYLALLQQKRDLVVREKATVINRLFKVGEQEPSWW